MVRRGLLQLIPVKEQYVESSFQYILSRHLLADDVLQLFSSVVGLCEVFVAADEFLCAAANAEGFGSFNVDKDVEIKRLMRRLKL